MNGFLDGLLAEPDPSGLERWRAEIDLKREAVAARRRRDQAAAHPQRPATTAAIQPAPPPHPQVHGPEAAPNHDGRRSRSQALGDRIVELYAGGDLGHDAIARILGCSSSTVAYHLTKRGIRPLRPRGHRLSRPTGSKPKEYDPALVETVRRLAAQDLTQDEIAARTRTTRKVVSNVMRRHQIPTRPAIARTPRDHAAALRTSMRQAGVTAADVRAWARAGGLEISDRGLPPRRILEAFLGDTGARTEQGEGR